MRRAVLQQRVCKKGWNNSAGLESNYDLLILGVEGILDKLPQSKQLTWLALGVDQAARSRRVEQLIAL